MIKQVAVCVVALLLVAATNRSMPVDNNEQCIHAHVDPNDTPAQAACGHAGCSTAACVGLGQVHNQVAHGGNCDRQGPGCTLFGPQVKLAAKKWKCEQINVDCSPGEFKCSWGIQPSSVVWVTDCKQP